MSDPTGPNLHTLKSLHEIMPSMIEGLKEKRITGRGKPVESAKPRQLCRVCAKLFDYATSLGETEMKSGTCETCAAELKAGYVALVCGNKFAFVKGKTIADLAGEVVTLPPEKMLLIEKQFQAEWKTNAAPESSKPAGDN